MKDYMANQTDYNNSPTVDFGKIAFVHKNHTIPALPDMNLIVLKHNDTFQAICIDIEIDAIGNTFEESCENLKKALYNYISQMIDNYDNNINSAVEDIINTAYSQGDTKSQLFSKYKQAKHQYLLDKVAKKHKAKSKREELFYALKTLFQSQPIQLNLTLAAGII